jgi:hypothetical protein
MSYNEHPCIECPGMPNGCRFDKKRGVCVAMPASPATPTDRLKTVLSMCENLTASTAYIWLEQFSGPNEIIWPLKSRGDGVKGERRLKSFVKADAVNWCMANNVNFKFWGGPPNSLGYYNGSLQTLLMDRVLSHVDTYGIEATEAMFQPTVTPCSA